MPEIDPLEGLRGFASQETTRTNPLDESGLGRDAFLKIFLTVKWVSGMAIGGG